MVCSWYALQTPAGRAFQPVFAFHPRLCTKGENAASDRIRLENHAREVLPDGQSRNSVCSNTSRRVKEPSKGCNLSIVCNPLRAVKPPHDACSRL
jgi:hypothetical protein